ncbi:hypothetical protein, partial [Burkholderia ubonensis]|uniref:hypothetical protein n=1 Tax=Burkholderia ubonensis TaxID=101571 RepID=UPI001587DAAA
MRSQRAAVFGRMRARRAGTDQIVNDDSTTLCNVANQRFGRHDATAAQLAGERSVDWPPEPHGEFHAEIVRAVHTTGIGRRDHDLLRAHLRRKPVD